LVDDAVDGVTGGTKARYVAIAVSLFLPLLSSFKKAMKLSSTRETQLRYHLGVDTLWKLNDPLPYLAVRIERFDHFERFVAICIPGTLR
jgi:hypothetical protein